VSGVPKIQSAGVPFRVSIDIRNLGGTVKPFCIDFDDDKSSWSFVMPAGYSEWKKDVFCLGTLRGHSHRVVRATLIPAKAGAHKLGITIGKGHVYKEIRTVLIDDSNALYWSQECVIVG